MIEMTTQRIDLSNRIRQDLLYRLRWNIFAVSNEIEITTDPSSSTSYVPLLTHFLAGAPFAEPPLTHIHQVDIKDCAEKARRQNRHIDDLDDETYRYVPPAPLEILNEDDVLITLGPFVTGVHEYLKEHANEIMKVKGETYGKRTVHNDDTQANTVTYGQRYLPQDAQVYFSGILTIASDESVCVTVKLWVEGELGRSPETFWSTQLGLAKSHENSRAAS